MKRLSPFIAAIIFSLVIVIASLVHALKQHPPYAPQVNAEQQADGALKGEKDTKPSEPHSTTSDEHHSGKDAEQREEQGTEFWPAFFGLKIKITDSLLAAFTFGLLVFTGLLWKSTDKLWRAGERQLNLAADTSSAQSRDMQASVAVATRSAVVAERALTDLERPWVFVFNVSRPTNEANGEFFVEYTVANYGKMPAIINAPCIGFVFSDADGLPQSPILLSEDHVLVAAPIMKAGEERRIREYFPVNPQELTAYRVVNEGTPQQSIEAIPSVNLTPNLRLFFRAEISYRGPSSKGHETRANWLYREPWDFVIRGDQYNYTK